MTRRIRRGLSRLFNFSRPTSLLRIAKYGSGWILLIWDLFLLCLLIYEVRIKLDNLSLDLSELLQLSQRAPLSTILALSDFLILLCLPLFLVTLVNFVSFRSNPEFYYAYTAASNIKAWLILLHVLISLICASYIQIVPAAQQLLGFCGDSVQTRYCFTSQLLLLQQFRAWFGGLTLFSAIFSLVWSAGWSFISRGKEILRDFDFWRLIGSAGEYQPAYGEGFLYANTASMAPNIQTIAASMSAYHREYQRRVPTSEHARKFVKENAETARRLLGSYLFPTEQSFDPSALSIEFFPGTSRALEAGLLRIPDVSHVVLSQYEHPSQVDVIRWLSLTNNAVEYSNLTPPSPSFFNATWSEQKESVCSRILQAFPKGDDKRGAVIISEVHYLTGIHVRVREVIETLRNEVGSRLSFIIDGSQAVGNLEKPFSAFASALQKHDFYYFSAHKWLLSPTTCGVLVSRDSQTETPRPYDMFGSELPTATIDPNTVFGLAAALEFLFETRLGFDRSSLFSRLTGISSGLKRRFRILLRDRFEIVESSTSELNDSLFLALRPRSGYEWLHPIEAFWEELRNLGIDLTLVPGFSPHFDSPEEKIEDSKNYLLRISFPFFLLGGNASRLARALNHLVVLRSAKRANGQRV